MTTYVYKSTTGHPVNIDDFTITPNPGLQLKYPNDILDTYLGTSINRYDDGVLVSSDPESPVMARKTLTGVTEIPSLAKAGYLPASRSGKTVVAVIGDSITNGGSTDATTFKYTQTATGFVRHEKWGNAIVVGSIATLNPLLP